MFHRNHNKSKAAVKTHVSRRSLLKRGALVGGLTAFTSAFSLTPKVSEAHAATSSKKWTVTPIQETHADKYIQAVLTSQEYKDFQKLVQTQGAPTLQGSQAVVNHYSQGQIEIISVIHSVTRGEERSTYTVLFQPGSFTPTKATGLVFVAIQGQSNMAATAVVNGEEIIHAIMTPTGTIVTGEITAYGRQVTLDGLEPSQAFEKVSPAHSVTSASCCGWCCWWNCFNSNGGIPPGILFLVGLACAAACIIPPACVVCILSLGTLNGLAVEQCNERCC